MKQFYVGVQIEEWVNKEVEVLDQVDMIGTKRDVPVYLCVDNDGVTHKIAGCNLSDYPVVNRTFVTQGLQDCFPDNVPRFESFSPRGKYCGDYY